VILLFAEHKLVDTINLTKKILGINLTRAQTSQMEDSFTFSPPSSPSSYCSPPVASPRDVYHDLELEEFGTEELVDSDNYKTGSRLDLNLELQVLVAENGQLHQKLEAAQAEKADAIQMWRKQREENKVRWRI